MCVNAFLLFKSNPVREEGFWKESQRRKTFPEKGERENER